MVFSPADRICPIVAALFLVAVPCLHAGIGQGLTGYWKLDSDLADESPTAADGTFVGTAPVAYAAGRFGTGIELDGIDQHVVINSVPVETFDFGTGTGGTGSVTISAWFKTGPWDGTAWQAIIAKGELTNWRLARSNGTNNLDYAGGSAGIVSGNVNDGEWHHVVAITEAGVSTRLWVDGVLVSTGAAPTLGTGNGKAMMIGNNPERDTRSWKGSLDDIAVWDRPLTPAEIASLWNNGTGASLESLINVDTDGDRIFDRLEILWGTDPTDPNSPLLDWNDGLAAYWAMDGDYTDAVAISGVPANGTLKNPHGPSADFVAGKFGQAANLSRNANNRNEYIAIESVDENWFDFSTSLSASTYPTATGKVTISAWCKTAAFNVNWQAIIAKGEGGSYRLSRRNDRNGPAFSSGGVTMPGNAVANQFPINDNQWHHIVAISEDGVSTRLWVDGELVATGAAPVLADGSSFLLIGGNPEVDAAERFRSWNGQIDDVALWSRALSPLEIYAIYYGGEGTSIGQLRTIGPDNDGMDDEWEILYGLNPNINDADLDLDGDGLTNLAEFQAGTNPAVADTDGDGADDALELAFGSDPLDPDSKPPADLQLIGQANGGETGKFLGDSLPQVTPGNVAGENWQTEDYFTGQGLFEDLKGLTAEPNSDFLAVVERRGTIQRVDASDRTTTGRLQTLDIRSRIVYGDNGGLRSVAFPPDYNVPGAPGEHHVYVFYSTEAKDSVPGFTAPYLTYPQNSQPYFFYRLSRFTRNPATGVFDPASELVMIQQMTRDRGQHFGGALTFGIDGFLHVGWGDTEFRTALVGVPFYQDAQRIDRIFQAAILRLDVKMQGGEISQPPVVALQGDTGPKAIAGAIQSCTPDHNYYHKDNFSGVGYFIPKDNHWILNPTPPGQANTTPAYPAHGPPLGEHQAMGIRNPWRFTTDPVSGDIAMFIVGSNVAPESETVNILRPGANYGWPYLEGEFNKTHETFRTMPPGGDSYAPVFLGNFTLPLATRAHTTKLGTVSTGGLYYRGTRWPSLSGKLITADHATGIIWGIDYLDKGEPVSDIASFANSGGFKHSPNFGLAGLIDTSHAIRQMSASPDGQEILIAANRNIWRLYNATTPDPQPPELLSQTGAFGSLSPLTNVPGMVPYEPAAPLWSDRAHKERWMAVPNDVGGLPGVHDAAGEKILFSENGEWAFPKGTVFVKHFAMPLDERDPENPSLQKNIETRFAVHGEDGTYFFFSYKWNADDTEATLIPDGDTTALDEDYTITGTDGIPFNQRWNFPSRAQCTECHQTEAGSVLGVKTRQLGNFLAYPGSTTKSHQLATMSAMGMFDQKLDPRDLVDYLQSKDLDDTTVSKEHRVRSYLDSNCSHCHRPGGDAGQAQFDALLTTPFSLAGLLNVDPNADDLGVAGAKIIAPRDPSRSVLWLRDAAVGPNQMPPLGKNVNHGEYIDLLTDWIKRMGLPGFDAWADGHGITGGPEDDFDGDEVNNALEYLTASDPKEADIADPGSIGKEGGEMVFSIPLAGAALADGFTPAIVDSEDLLDWKPAGTPGSILEPLDDSSAAGVDGFRRWRFMPGDKGFVRTGVNVPAP